MGKMKMGHNHRELAKPIQAVESNMVVKSTPDLDETIKKVLEAHKETIQKLVHMDQKLVTMPPSTETIVKEEHHHHHHHNTTTERVVEVVSTKDKRARLHSRLSKKHTTKMVEDAKAELRSEAIHDMKEIAQLKARITELEGQKREVIPTVMFDYDQPEPRLDKRMLAIVIVTTLMNLALILINK